MSGFFQLRPGSQSNQGNQQSQEIPPFFLYHPTLHYRNLELWHAQQQQQQGGGGGESSNNMSMDQASEGHEIVPAGARAPGWGAMRGVGLAGGGGGRSCQDCGNQAKKDCSHLRCRTCCKSRGFHCATHVKSTWVPAARRRERQLQRSATVAGESSKRLRENPHQTSCTRLQLPSTATGIIIYLVRTIKWLSFLKKNCRKFDLFLVNVKKIFCLILLFLIRRLR